MPMVFCYNPIMHKSRKEPFATKLRISGSVFCNHLRIYAIYLLALLFYVALFIFASFFAHVVIHKWTLAVSFISYNAIAAIYLLIRQKTEYLKSLGLMALLTLIVFIVSAALFARTYDVSYDGMFYHEPAIIALSKGWNPIYQKALPINDQETLSRQLIEGSPKAIWVIEASINKLTENIDAATCLNLIIGLIALIFVYTTLRELGLDHISSLTLALLAVLIEITIDQFFSFREDGISYEFLLIALSSIAMLVKQKSREIYFFCLVISLIFLAATKLSNVIVIAPLLIVIIYLATQNHWYKQRQFRLSLGVGVMAAFLLMFNPYITNIYKYRAIDYPYNLPVVANSAKDAALPVNLRSDNKIELLLYGIFGRTNDKDTVNPASQAKLKIPFKIYPSEINAEADNSAKTIGGYGLIFSGILIVSLLAYVYILSKKGVKGDSIRWLSVSIVLIILACLLNPVPSYARYSPELELVPLFIVLTFILINKKRMLSLNNAGKLPQAITALIALNTVLALLLVSSTYSQNFSDLNSQLNALKSSNSTYLTYSGHFYSNYNLLSQHGVKIKASATPLECQHMEILYYSRNTTELCKLSLN
jgi:hypothetical protein